MKKLEENIWLIDLEPNGYSNFAASYVLKGRQAAIIEAGPSSSVPNLLSNLREMDVKPEEIAYVAVSHIHLDHSGGVGTLVKSLPNTKVIVHPKGAPHLANPEKLWKQSKEALGQIAELYGEPEPVPKEKIVQVTDKMSFDIGNNIRLKVIETLGHASHHQSYMEIPGRGIFPGDAAGIYLGDLDSVVPTTPAPYHLDTALKSLDKLIELRPRILYYSHFGAASDSVNKLKTYADQLKLWLRIVKQGIKDKHNLEMIRERIIESDKAVNKVAEFIKAHRILNETVFDNSLQGIVWFAQKHNNPPVQ